MKTLKFILLTILQLAVLFACVRGFKYYVDVFVETSSNEALGSLSFCGATSVLLYVTFLGRIVSFLLGDTVKQEDKDIP